MGTTNSSGVNSLWRLYVSISISDFLLLILSHLSVYACWAPEESRGSL